jgi:hypothetical protein
LTQNSLKVVSGCGWVTPTKSRRSLVGLIRLCCQQSHSYQWPPFRKAVRFYPEMLGHLLKVVLPRELDADTSEVIIITDAIPVNRKRRAVEKAVRTTLARMLPPGMNYRVLHHQSRSHYGLQVADYCCWAVFRKWQRGESAWYDRIKPAVCNEFEI